MTTHLLHWTKSDEKIERVTFTADQGALVFTPRIDQPEMKLDVTGHVRAKMQMRALRKRCCNISKTVQKNVTGHCEIPMSRAQTEPSRRERGGLPEQSRASAFEF